MTLDGFLGITSMLVTIASVGIANNKKLWLYKFGKMQWTVVLIIFFAIHYCLFFHFFYHHGLYIQFLMIKGGPQPETWAYFLSFFLLVYVLYVLFRPGFPSCNNDKVISYYKGLIDSNLQFLIETISLNHETEIKEHLRKLNKDYEEDMKSPKEDIPIHIEKPEENIADTPEETIPIGNRVLEGILFDETFIQESIKRNPSFFLKMVCTSYNNSIIGLMEAVQQYFRILISQRNSVLVRELKNMINFDETHRHKYRKEDNSILLRLTFQDLRFAYNMNVLKAFGEEALKNAEQGSHFFNKKTNEWIDDEYHSTPAYQFLRFADIFVRELLYAKIDETYDRQQRPYWYYLKLICEQLIVNRGEDFENSYSYKYIQDAKDNIRFWFIAMAELEKDVCAYSLLVVLQEIINEFENNQMHEQAVMFFKNYIEIILSVEETGCRMKKESNSESLPKTCLDEFSKYANTQMTLLKEAWDESDFKIKNIEGSPIIETIKRMLQ